MGWKRKISEILAAFTKTYFTEGLYRITLSPHFFVNWPGRDIRIVVNTEIKAHAGKIRKV